MGTSRDPAADEIEGSPLFCISIVTVCAWRRLRGTPSKTTGAVLISNFFIILNVKLWPSLEFVHNIVLSTTVTPVRASMKAFGDVSSLGSR